MNSNLNQLQDQKNVAFVLIPTHNHHKTHRKAKSNMYIQSQKQSQEQNRPFEKA